MSPGLGGGGWGVLWGWQRLKDMPPTHCRHVATKTHAVLHKCYHQATSQEHPSQLQEWPGIQHCRLPCHPQAPLALCQFHDNCPVPRHQPGEEAGQVEVLQSLLPEHLWQNLPQGFWAEAGSPACLQGIGCWRWWPDPANTGRWIMLGHREGLHEVQR